jgi:hypothetical protein
MSDDQKRKTTPEETTEANRKISRGGERDRKEAAAAKLSPAVPAAGAAILTDADPALDTESETEASARRATGRDRLTGES